MLSETKYDATFQEGETLGHGIAPSANTMSVPLANRLLCSCFVGAQHDNKSSAWTESGARYESAVETEDVKQKRLAPFSS